MLPQLNVSQLSPVGTAGGDTSFSIELQCGAGNNVYVTLTDATDPGNRTELLTLADDSSASGVKLRVRKSDDSFVPFGPDSAAPGNTNQWLVGPSATTSAIPLKVQYVSTGTVTPGTVNARATFTLSYQ
jgi:type 1 fimbria pilin